MFTHILSAYLHSNDTNDYCSNFKNNCYNLKINFYYSQQTPESYLFNFQGSIKHKYLVEVMKMTESSYMFFKMWADMSFKHKWWVPEELLSPAWCPARSTSTAAVALWSHGFTFPWYFSSFDHFASLYHLPPLTWHIREAGISSYSTTSGHSKTLPSPWQPEQSAATRGKKTPIKTSRALCYTNSSKPCIIYRAKLLQ